MKFDIFDYCGPAKLEIWPNQESSVELKIGVKLDIFDHHGAAKFENRPNEEISIAFKI